MAQPPAPGGTPPSPEKMAKAWALEAKTVAQDLGLPAELTAKLVDAYKAARESQMAAVAAKLGQGRGQRDFAAIREVAQAEKAKFETALKGFLNPEQTTKALAVLGTFNRRWDLMAAALDGMNLDEKKMAEAMKLVAGYVAESDKAMQAAMASGNRESMRETGTKLKEKLDGDMAKILSAEQMTKWNEATARRGGPGRPGGQPAPAPAAK
jgi:hypothetical protein